MNKESDWGILLSSSTAKLSDCWFTRASFDAEIRGLVNHEKSPIEGLSFEFRFDQPYGQFTVGIGAEGEASSSESIDLNDERNGTCRVRWWQRKGARIGGERLRDGLKSLAIAWWKPDLRTPSAGLPDLKRDGKVLQISEATIQLALRHGRHPSVLSCDLDNFGLVNKTLGQSRGDEVIEQFGALAERAVEPFGTILHNGGDELVILCPDGGAHAAIRAAYSVASAASSHDFDIGQCKVGVSAGCAGTNSPLRIATFDELCKEAEQALKDHAKKPEKGKARFLSPAVGSGHSGSDDIRSRIAMLKCLVSSARTVAEPFGSAWMNALSTTAYEAALGKRDGIGKAVTSLLAWMGLSKGGARIAGGLKRSPSADVSVEPVATQIDIALAIAHGILRANGAASEFPGCKVAHSMDGDRARVEVGNLTIWETDSATDLSEGMSFGVVTEGCEGARAVLIKIGHEVVNLPAALFSDVIVVDDRPTRGGGLPDFWQVTIARLVAHVCATHGVQAAFVLGNLEHAKETVSKLKEVKKWQENAEGLSDRLSVSSSMIRMASERLAGHIFFPKDERELLTALGAELDSVSSHQYANSREKVAPSVRSMDRRLELGPLSLDDSDGCRAQSIDQAYPVVLEILRKSKAPLIRDQAGASLKELVDFKVRIGQIGSGLVPEYFRSDVQNMEEYFTRTFIEGSSFFGEAFRRDGQLDRVLDHVAAVINSDEPFVTRRAVLIVPPDTSSSGEWTPLGLISICLIPRFVEDGCEVSFSYSWRTVEALVGFPYSIFGSAKFAQELIRMLHVRLKDSKRPLPRLGYLNYIAHSLHMFVDDYGQAIARRIVNDATY